MTIIFIPVLLAAVLTIFAHRAGIKRRVSLTDRYCIGGICGGLAAHFNLPLPLVRVLMLLFMLATEGFVTLAYVILWYTLPMEQTVE